MRFVSATECCVALGSHTKERIGRSVRDPSARASPTPKNAVAHFRLGVVRSVTTRLARPILLGMLHPRFRDDSLSLSSLHLGLSSGRPDWAIGATQQLRRQLQHAEDLQNKTR